MTAHVVNGHIDDDDDDIFFYLNVMLQYMRYGNRFREVRTYDASLIWKF